MAVNEQGQSEARDVHPEFLNVSVDSVPFHTASAPTTSKEAPWALNILSMTNNQEFFSMFQILSDITKEHAFSDREAVRFGVWSTGSEYKDSILGTLTDYQWDRKQMTCLIVPRFPHLADGDDSAVYLLGFSQGLSSWYTGLTAGTGDTAHGKSWRMCVGSRFRDRTVGWTPSPAPSARTPGPHFTL